jgi:hypothetical protein
LLWEESKWIEYVSNKNVKTYIFKKKNDLVGFFELLEHTEKKEIEIAYFGLLEDITIKNWALIYYQWQLKNLLKIKLIEFGFILVL